MRRRVTLAAFVLGILALNLVGIVAVLSLLIPSAVWTTLLGN